MATPALAYSVESNTTESAVTRGIRNLELSRLMVDNEHYQRAINMRWVHELARDWDDDAADPLTVSERTGGVLVILKGQHRRLALMEREEQFKDGRYTHWKCDTFTGLTLEREARIFRLGNKMKPQDILNDFRAAVTAKDPVESAIASIVNAAGYRIAYDHKQGREMGITAIDALRTVYGWGVLPVTLDVMRRTWPEDSDTTQRTFLLAVGAILRAYEGDRRFRAEDAVRRMGTQLPKDLLIRTTALNGLKKKKDGKAWTTLFGLLLEEINKRRQEPNKLEVPKWNSAIRSWKRLATI